MLNELLRYFSDRRARLVEPDAVPPRVSPQPEWRRLQLTRPAMSVAIILLMGAFALLTVASYVAVVVRGGGNSSGIDMDANRFRSLRENLPARGVVAGYNLSDTTEWPRRLPRILPRQNITWRFAVVVARRYGA